MTNPPARRRRRWSVVILSILGVLVASRAAAGLWGRSRMDALMRESEPEWTEARARLEALRHPWDPAATEPCAAAYAGAAVRLEDDSRTVNDAVNAPPRVRPSAEARAIVEARRSAIDAFLRASACGSYAPRPDEAWAPFDAPFPMLGTARLVVLDARLRAEAGDVKGAVDRLIAVTKAGTDVGEGTLVGTLIGGAMISVALETLSSLVADGRVEAADRERIERALAALAPRMPTIAGGIAKERLHLRWAAQKIVGGADAAQMRAPDAGEAPGGSPGWVSWTIPASAVFADGALEQRAFLKEAEAIVLRERDGDAVSAALEAVEPKSATARWTGLGLPAHGLASQVRNMCAPAAWERLTSAVLAIAKSGAVPDALAAPVADPCAAGDLAYARTVDGRYLLSSAGKDGRPSNDDLRVEPAVASPPAKVPAAAAVSIDERASLSFVQGGKAVRDVALGEMLRDLPAETFTAYDPYYNRDKTFRAVPLADVVKKGFAGVDVPLPEQEYVLRARDGFTVPMRGAKVFEAGAFVAFADVDAPGWEPIGPQRANPGPFYLVWRNKEQQSLETHPRPWQLASIEIARFEDLFPHTAPKGQAAGSAAMRGFAIFKEHCVHCHAVNREGGRVGPELNVPKSIVEYRPVDQIKAYVRDPLAFRYGNMPAHPFLKDGDLDDLVAYFGAMKDDKHDPAGKGPGKK